MKNVKSGTNLLCFLISEPIALTGSLVNGKVNEVDRGRNGSV